MYTSALKLDERLGNPLPPEPEGAPALEVRAVYNGRLLGTRFLPEIAPKRRLHKVSAQNHEDSYTIGQSAQADAPAPTEILGAPEMPLVSRWGAGFLINTTPGMTGDVAVGGRVYRLADYLAGRGYNFTLPADGRARINCGTVCFQLRHTTSAAPLPRRWFTWSWSEQKFNLGAVFGLGMLLLLCFAVPPDGASVSGDILGLSRPYVPMTIKPPVSEPIPEILTQRPDKGPGEAGKPHAGDAGTMGNPNSKKANAAHSIKGDGRDMHLSKEQAVAAIQHTGILSILGSPAASRFASIFGRDLAVGDAKEDLMGNLLAANLGDAFGANGLGVRGTGNGGAGTGIGTLGIGSFNTLGGPGYGHGPGVGSGLRAHHTIAPGVVSGAVTTRGSLDKEIVRRVVRLHMNEVKYCYDQELVRKPSLEGRIAVQFVIAANGQVLSSVMNSTTMNNVRVEKCVVDAVKRWPFPAPQGGGIVIVAYPFNFTAGAGS